MGWSERELEMGGKRERELEMEGKRESWKWEEGETDVEIGGKERKKVGNKDESERIEIN